MRKLSSQLLSMTIIIVLISSVSALLISDLLANILFSGLDYADVITLGLAFKEVLMPVIAIIMTLVQIKIYSKSIINPIRDLTNATIRIASGKFDTNISENTKIREIATLQNNFNIMARELRSNEILKRDFVSNVSHEFKTPLAVIKGYADLLSDETLSAEERAEYARIIAKETDRLSHLTSNMLKMSKLNNQEIIVSPKSFMLDEQIRRCILLVMGKMNEKNITIEPELVQTEISGDEELLSQVWLNLLDNAIKYTNEGGKIWVELTVKPNGRAVVVISDNGIGMDEKTRCKVFEQFYQADSSHGKDGNGLGLAIVSKIVRLHGGKINVKSAEGEGSSFRVSLPAKPPAEKGKRSK